MKSSLGIIFDCDGTLLDSMGVWHDLDDRLAARVGIELAQEDREFMTAATLQESSVYLHEKLGVGESVQDVVDIIRDDMLDFYTNEAKPKPGALEFVQGLAELGIPMGIASSTPPSLLRKGLEVAGFAPYMKAIYSVEDINSSKREPLVYDAVRAELGTEKKRTWAFEDAVYALETLRKAGYPTFAIYDSEIAGTPSVLESVANGFIMSFEEITAAEFVDFAESCAKR